MNGAFLGWAMLSRDALGRAEQMLAPDEQGVVDEVGVLLIHQALADRFFPGTSVLHTRLRYALFVPWIIEDLFLEKKQLPRPVETLEDREYELGRRLKRAYESMPVSDEPGPPTRPGIIGRTIDRKPKQPASYAYWSALRAWGIVHSTGGTSRSAVLRELNRFQDPQLEGDEDNRDLPLCSLPPREKNWFKRPLTFELPPKERIWFRDKLSEVPHPDGSNRTSLLSSIVARLDELDLESIQHPWDAEIRRVARDMIGPDEERALDFAGRAAALSAICRAAYGALVEAMGTRVDRLDLPNNVWERVLNRIVDEHSDAAARVTADEIAKFIRSPEHVTAMLVDTVEWLHRRNADPSSLHDTYADCELKRKRNRARLQLSLNARERRAEWLADSKPDRVRPLDYRWWTVKGLLMDLKTGQA